MADKMPYEKKESSDMEEAEVAEMPDTGDAGDMSLGEVEEASVEEEMPEGEEYPPEEGEEGGMEYASFEEGAMGLLEEWQPTTPEGEKYKADLQELYEKFHGGGEEDMGPMEYEGGGLAPKAFGFQIGVMGKEAAKRAMGGKE